MNFLAASGGTIPVFGDYLVILAPNYALEPTA